MDDDPPTVRLQESNVPGMADAPRMYRVLRRILPPVLNRYFELEVEGLENVPVSEPAILASNHLSFLDSIVLPINVPRPVYFLGKSEYFESWRTRWFFEGTGVVPVDRGGGRQGAASLRTGVEILRRGELLGIYPEGTRSPDGRLYRGKTGPVRMAIEADVPILPCAVIGSDRALPTGSWVPRPHRVTVRYGAPLDVRSLCAPHGEGGSVRAATARLMEKIRELSGQEYVDEYAARVKAGEVDVAGFEPKSTNLEDGSDDDDGPVAPGERAVS